MVLMGLLPLLAAAQPDAPEGTSRAMIVRLKPLAREGQLLSGAEQDVRRQRLSKLALSAGYTGSMGWRSVGGHMAVMKTPSALKPEVARKVMARMLATGEIEWAEPSVRQKLLAVTPPNDTYYGYSDDQGQWWARAAVGSNADSKAVRQRGAPNINVAWNTTTGQTQANGTVVAVLDTGYVPHPDINPAQVLPGYDFVSDTRYDRDAQPGRDNDPADPGDWVTSAQAAQSAFRELDCGATKSSWHGLAVSGVIAAHTDNGAGMAAVNWATRLLPIRVSGMCGADMVDIIDAMRWAAGLSSAGGVTNTVNRAKIINISFGSDKSCGPAYQAVIDEVRAAGVVVVAAAGNEHGAVARPANCRGVVAVAGLNRDGFKATYSNFGAEVTVSTVGGDPGPAWGSNDGGAWGSALQDAGILTLHNNGDESAEAGGDYRNFAGTSFSAPITAGVVALMLDANPNLTPDEIIAGLKASARPHVQSNRIGACSSNNPGRCICTTSTCGQGILDAGEAVQYALAKVTASPYVRPTLLAENIDSAEVGTALSLASADRPPNPTVTDSTPAKSGGGGGGGAFDPVSLVASALFAAALALSRRSRCLAAV